MTIEEAIVSQDFKIPALDIAEDAPVEELREEIRRLNVVVDTLTIDLEVSEKRRYRHIKRFLLKRRQYRVALQNIMAAEQTNKWMRRAEYLMRHLRRLKELKDARQEERDGARLTVRFLLERGVFDPDVVRAVGMIMESWGRWTP